MQVYVASAFAIEENHTSLDTVFRHQTILHKANYYVPACALHITGAKTQAMQ